MARKPNYSFERHERDRAKALKLAAKAEAKRQQREGVPSGDAALVTETDGASGATPVPDEA